MNKRVTSVLIASGALAVVLNVAGCSNTPSGTGLSEEEQVLELEKRYATGAISKEQYERERAELHARTQREAIQSGSPMNETIRGFRR